MINRNLCGLLLLCVFTLTAGCQFKPAAPSAVPPTAPPSGAVVTPSPLPALDPVAEMLAGMTTEQKVGQLLVAGIVGTTPGADAAAAIEQYQVGGIILFKRNVEYAKQLVDLTNGLKAMNGDYIPLFMCVDEEGGRVSRMPPEVADLPSAYDYTSRGGNAAALGRVLAAECKAFGFNVDFAPSLDIWSNPDNTVIGDRAFGTDWEQVQEAGTQTAGAMMAAGVIPVVKHFPGHGDTDVDSHEGLPAISASMENLSRNELKPFAAAIAQGAPAVMVGHLLMTSIDPDRLATLSPAVVTDLLRGKLDFQGVVFTDDLTMRAISRTYGMGEACVLAFEAGCEGLLVCHAAENLTAGYDALLEAVKSARISAERLDESVYRILSLKRDYGVSGDTVNAPDVHALNAKIKEIVPK